MDYVEVGLWRSSRERKPCLTDTQAGKTHRQTDKRGFTGSIPFLPHPGPRCRGRSCRHRSDGGTDTGRWGRRRTPAGCHCHGERPCDHRGRVGVIISSSHYESASQNNSGRVRPGSCARRSETRCHAMVTAVFGGEARLSIRPLRQAANTNSDSSVR